MPENTYKKRFLFSIKVKQATCSLVFSVAGDDQATAFKSMKAGDQNTKLVYDEIHLGPYEEPEYMGIDPTERSPNV